MLKATVILPVLDPEPVEPAPAVADEPAAPVVAEPPDADGELLLELQAASSPTATHAASRPEAREAALALVTRS
jgi:hypothetical protein